MKRINKKWFLLGGALILSTLTLIVLLITRGYFSTNTSQKTTPSPTPTISTTSTPQETPVTPSITQTPTTISTPIKTVVPTPTSSIKVFNNGKFSFKYDSKKFSISSSFSDSGSVTSKSSGNILYVSSSLRNNLYPLQSCDYTFKLPGGNNILRTNYNYGWVKDFDGNGICERSTSIGEYCVTTARFQLVLSFTQENSTEFDEIIKTLELKGC